ncbi:hypothetical protein RclHR1_13580001 [Rhizophagus clarus]|uniref:P-loop containing nucleoside triphosphate hydrolase protein n=1 Tax=Rhizophagus clarus TaxID=94130 RepID=A0A2Z6QQW4_9GLOM|nr:hypothetical protein RclHR1_13580001 [Rhizophagus clarus]GET02168.1 P-loop containing nucleoside triphosphate hydrolase protein [Rhizophagus clarus]
MLPNIPNIVLLLEFADLFMADKWEKKVVLFVDEYDRLKSADDGIKSSFMSTVRGIKTTKEDYEIMLSGPLIQSDLQHLIPEIKNLTTSSFNVGEPFYNSNLTREQVQNVFKEYMDYEIVEIDSKIIDDIYMRTNGHAGLVCLCGKVIVIQTRINDENLSFQPG